VTAHAEVSAIKKIKNKEKLKKATLFSVRINLNNELCNAKPCLACKNTMLRYGIKNVVYTNNQGEFVKEKVKNVTTCYTPATKIFLKNSKGYSDKLFENY